MFASARCNPHVLLQDGRTCIGHDHHEMDTDRAAVRNHRVPVRGFDVLHPIGDRPEHRDHVPLVRDRWNHDGVLTHAAGSAITYSQRDPRLRRQSNARPPAEELADAVAQPGRSSVSIEQSVEQAPLCRIGTRETGYVRRVDCGRRVVHQTRSRINPAGENCGISAANVRSAPKYRQPHHFIHVCRSVPKARQMLRRIPCFP